MPKPNPEMAEDQERRARDLADALRRYVVLVNSGAIVVIVGLTGSLVQEIDPRWAIIPVAIFFVSLCLAGWSFIKAKRKALARRNAYREGKEQPDYTKHWYDRNESWDGAAVVTFGLGALVALFCLWWYPQGDSYPLPPAFP